MEYLLFAGYLILFAWIATRVKFFTLSGLNSPQLIIIFLLKVMAGIFYGWIGLYYGNLAQMNDTWAFHYSSISEYRLLGSDPKEYFTNLFSSSYEEGYGRFFAGRDSYWNDLKGNFFIKILSIFNIFSFGNYYVNVIFYSFLSMFGPVAVYRVMIDVFPGKKLQVLIATFLIPSFLYWTSGLHKDGLIFTALAIVIFNVYFGLKNNSFTLPRIIYILFGLTLIVVFRNFLIVIVIPAVLAWILAAKFPKHALKIFATVYVLFAVFFFTARYINNKLDFPQTVVDKQEEFLKLQGGSAVPITKLEPNASSFLVNAPQALNLSMIRPYPSDVKHLLSLAAATEINILLLLFIIFLIWRSNGARSKTFIYFCIILSLTLLLSIGYTVNFLGAIVRYRSLVFPFLFVPMFCAINWKKLYQLVAGNMKNKNNVAKPGEIPD